jgi:L-histidine Nalpha-methyltransferase / hercynylcysteine S-oxide synthase
MVTKTKVSFPTSPEQYASSSVPNLSNWEELWAVWDTVTRGMITDAALHTKPIALRNDIIFYLGHIPVFLMIQLARETKQPPIEPKSYIGWFERGIDPDVDNPDECHWHSETPNSWPPVDEILDYQVRVRKVVQQLYADRSAETNRNIGRALWLGFEHEVMHLETLLYMLLQSDLTLPPPDTVRPDFEALALTARKATKENQWFDIPAQDVRIGMDDPDDDLTAQGHFGFDNEKPARTVHVPAFQAKARPITNGEYAEYMEKAGIDQLPSSWIDLQDTKTPPTTTRADSPLQSDVMPRPFDSAALPTAPAFVRTKAIRTVYGPVPLAYALDWPLFASYDELAGCAAWMGGRIPQLDEARSIYAWAETLQAHKADAVRAHARRIPAVNSHLLHDGVEETPPPPPAPAEPEREGEMAAEGEQRARGLFADLAGTNTGFAHWHPMPVTPQGDRLAGQGDLGGVWEWTASTLEPHQGFAPMRMYPGYTADFFDGKHNIVLGGSWCTHPRVAGRKSL